MLTRTIDLYQDYREVSLTTYLLDNFSEMSKGRNRPAVLICPGGGYLGCSDREAEPVALRFAGMGYHAFVLRYSTYYGKFPGVINSEGMIPKEDTMHPAPVRDIAQSFLVIRNNAQEWSVDVDQIVLCGFSAGAHNCIMYSVYWDKPLITDFFKEEASQFKPAAAILAYGLADFRLLKGHQNDEYAVTLQKVSAIALMGTTTPDKQSLYEVSPLRLISETTPPAFIWATSEDELVSSENSLEIASALAKAGIPYEIHIFESGQHGLSLADRSSAISEEQIDEDAAQWIRLAGKWLTKRIHMVLPEE